MTAIEIQKAKIRAAKADLKNAGPVHTRDIRRHIRRLQKELRIYISYQKKAASQQAST